VIDGDRWLSASISVGLGLMMVPVLSIDIYWADSLIWLVSDRELLTLYVMTPKTVYQRFHKKRITIVTRLEYDNWL